MLAIQNARLFLEIEEKSRQLAEASKHKSQFLANMSHELRTPMNAILGYTELILDGIYGEPSEKMVGVLTRVQTNGKHLLGLINDVLDLSKIEAGQLTLSLTDYSIKDMVYNVFGVVESLAKNKNLALNVEVPAQLPNAHGDERRLTQVLLNLVGNALKFTDEGGVTIKTVASHDSFTVSVTDTGPGIAPADQAKIFEEFQQAELLDHQAKGRHGPRPRHRQADRGDARRPAVGRIRAGQGLDLPVLAADQRRASGRAMKSGRRKPVKAAAPPGADRSPRAPPSLVRPADRAARASPRARRGHRGAEGHRRGAGDHRQLAGAAGTDLQRHPRTGDANLRRQVRRDDALRRRRQRFAVVALHNAPLKLFKARQRAAGVPAAGDQSARPGRQDQASSITPRICARKRPISPAISRH